MRSDASPLIQKGSNAQFGLAEGGAGVNITAGVTSLDVTHANSWSGIQTFGNGMLSLSGASSGSALLEAPATASGTYGLPAIPGATGCIDLNSSGQFAALSTDCPIGTLTPTVKTVNYTVLTTDQANYLGAGGSGSITFKLPNPGASPGASYPFYDSTLHGYSVTTIAGTALLAGNFSGGSATTQVIGTGGTVVCVDATTFYQCQYSPVAGTGSPAGSTGNPQYNAGSGFGADPGAFYLPAATGNATTDTANLSAAITAAQGVAAGGVGTILVPCGNYLINAVTWTGIGPAFVGTCHALSRNEGSPYYGSVFLHNSATGDMLADNNTSLTQTGPTFENIALIGQGSGTDTCLYAQSTNFGYVRHSTFRNCGTGVGLYDDSNDDSNWNIVHATFVNNGKAISCTGVTGGCDNYFGENYINVAVGQIGIYLDPSAQQVRIHGTHFDCGSDNNQTAVSTLGLSVIISGNNFEGCAPAVLIPTTATGSQGRGTDIADNGFTGSFTTVTITCTSGNSSTALTSCGSTTGLAAGMIAFGGNITTPYVYGTGAAGSTTNGNTLAGTDTVASFVTNASITLTQPTQGSGAGSASFTFCAPQYSWPIALPSGFPVLSHGNTFEQGCGTLHDGG